LSSLRGIKSTTNVYATMLDVCRICGTARYVQPTRVGRICKSCANRQKAADRIVPMRLWPTPCLVCGVEVILRRKHQPVQALCRSCIGKRAAAAVKTHGKLPIRVCEIKGCIRLAARRGLCRAHREAKRRADNPEHCRQVRILYVRKNKDRIRARQAARKSAIKGAYSDPIQRVELMSFYLRLRTAESIPCHWCGRITGVGERHGDHIIPIVKGGLHAIANLCCACVRCNTRKKAMMPEEFLVYGPVATG
jgi:5-methylcytosine-specific restriction endonuclease McrA